MATITADNIASVSLKDADDALSEAKLAPLLGKKIRLRGKVKVDRLSKPARPVIVIDTRSAILEVQ